MASNINLHTTKTSHELFIIVQNNKFVHVFMGQHLTNSKSKNYSNNNYMSKW